MRSHVAIKRQETLIPATTRMNPEGAVLCEVSQKAKDRHYKIPLVWGPQSRQIQSRKNRGSPGLVEGRRGVPA